MNNEPMGERKKAGGALMLRAAWVLIQVDVVRWSYLMTLTLWVVPSL